MKPRYLLSAALWLALSACAQGDVIATSPPPGYIGDAAARVKAADWSKAETVTVTLTSYEFAPRSLVFQAGKTYDLHLVNKAGTTHTFTAEEFFKAIAVQKLASPGGTDEAPYVENIALEGGAAKDLYFVAVKPGTYALHCAQPFHATLGMTGEITIR